MKKVFLIAEVAQAHEGSLGIAHSYIDALSKTGVDAVKFQTHIAEAESSEYEKFRIDFSYEDLSRYDYWKRMEFTLEQWAGLKRHCDDLQLEFISSPFSCAAVDLLEKVGVKIFKIASGEVANKLMLEKIANTGKDIILSSGMSSFEEIDQTINWLAPYNNKLSLLQCTTKYPTAPEDWGLGLISEMKKRYEIPVGFSDHSGEIFAGISASVLDADLIEFHAVFHKEMFGPDTIASLSIEQIKLLVDGVRQVERSKSFPDSKVITKEYSDLKIKFGKSLCVNKNLDIGHIITVDDLETKKPGNLGINPVHYNNVLGKKLLIRLNKWDFLKFEYLS